jgi:hypothetical protein
MGFRLHRRPRLRYRRRSSGLGGTVAVAVLALLGGAYALGGKSAVGRNYRTATPTTARTTARTIPPDGTASTQSGEQREEMVYISESDGDYHKEGCRWLGSSGRPISLSEAKKSHSRCQACLGDAAVRTTYRDTAPIAARGYTPGETASETTATGKTIYTGPRGGRYHYSASGKKVYEKKR